MSQSNLVFNSLHCLSVAFFGLKNNFSDNPKHFLINHGHFGAAFLVLMNFFECLAAVETCSNQLHLRMLYVMSENISAASLALLFADE